MSFYHHLVSLYVSITPSISFKTLIICIITHSTNLFHIWQTENLSLAYRINLDSCFSFTMCLRKTSCVNVFVTLTKSKLYICYQNLMNILYCKWTSHVLILARACFKCANNGQQRVHMFEMRRRMQRYMIIWNLVTRINSGEQLCQDR